jgi:hypothetical protein
MKKDGLRSEDCRLQNAECKMRNGEDGEGGLRSEELDGRDLEALRRMPGPAVPAGLEARIAARVRERQAGRLQNADCRVQNAERGKWARARQVMVSMAAVVLVVVGLWLGTRLGNSIFGGQSQRYAELLAGPGQSNGEGL